MPEQESTLPPDAATSADHRNPRRRNNRRTVQNAGQPPSSETPDLGVLVVPEPLHDRDRLVLHAEVREDILAGLRAIQRRADLEAVWSISQLQPQDGRCILNFHGPPGTGKTRAALGVALRLGQPLYQVDYSAVISKYIGDTAKHIAACFKRASELGAVLFFDEADSLLLRRVEMGESGATSINQNRNVLMQELDRFNGVVIVTTNLFGNYDPALLRRISRHIKFRLPDRAMRRRLFELHLPNRERVFADLDILATESKGLSGGDILNVCLNAIYAGSTADDLRQWRITGTVLLAEITKAKAAKLDHELNTTPRPTRPAITP